MIVLMCRIPVSKMLFCLFVSVSSSLLVADERVPIGERLHTDVKFELILPQERANGLASQQWADVFRRMDVPLRIRQPLFNDKLGIDQETRGTIRRVVVTGHLDRNGVIIFPGKKFRLNELTELKSWIEELREYGAQGAPEGQPLWGLKKAEFELLLGKMNEVVVEDTTGKNLIDVILLLDLPKEYPLRFSEKAKQVLGPTVSLPLVRNNVAGLAKGTALSLVLREYAVSFAPKRLPDESIQLEVLPVEQTDDPWPIGWDPDTLGLTRLEIARKLFISVPVQVDQMAMSEMLAVLEQETGIPVYVDGLALRSLNYDFDQVQVTYPRKRTSWSLCLRTLVSKLQLTQELRVDENDRAFLWITRFQPQKRVSPGVK